MAVRPARRRAPLAPGVASLTGKVLDFPRKGPPRTEEELVQCGDAIKEVHVDYALAILVGTVIDQLVAGGFCVDDDLLVKDMALVFTAMRSAMLKVHGVPHPFQRIAEEVFIDHGDGEVSVDVDKFMASRQDLPTEETS